MPLIADDLDVKYGVVGQNDVTNKKKRRKSKGRTFEVDFPLYSNGLIQSYESNICSDPDNREVLPAHFADMTEVGEPFQLSNSDTALLPSISSLSNTGNDQILTLLKDTLNSTSSDADAQIKPLSAITNDFTKLSQRYLNGTGTVGTELDNTVTAHHKVAGSTMIHKRLSADELLAQQKGDIFYDQNVELIDRKLPLQDARLHLETEVEGCGKKVRREIIFYLFNVEKSKEILDLRLGKAKALANKRMGQAELALKHANVIHNRIEDEAVKSDIKQMIRQWEQILRDYKAWHANLDRIVDGQKAQVDSNYRFDELALLSPPDNIPCAPQLPPNALKYFQQLEFECSSGDPSTELLRVIGPPVGFEKETLAGSRFGAIGQPAPTPQRKIFSETQINKLVSTFFFFDFPVSREQIRSVVSELERRSLMLSSDVSVSSVLSHVIRRVMEATGANPGSNSQSALPSYWASLSSEQPTMRRFIDLESQDCKICLQPMAHGEKLLQCPSCVDSYHYECGIKWLKQNSTCPHCRRLWSNPDDFPSLAKATT
uniref:RING-type domain-containing protein n=1 Tax=Setaria digitata TaxID=48799 RepID=A0A915PLE3_9BILA